MTSDEVSSSAASPLRVDLERVIAQAIAESWDEGYGDCPHGYRPCAACDAHLAADAVLRRFRVGARKVPDGS